MRKDNISLLWAIFMVILTIFIIIFVTNVWGVHFDDIRFWLGIIPAIIIGIPPLFYLVKRISNRNIKQ
jgi:hypothetical protein